MEAIRRVTGALFAVAVLASAETTPACPLIPIPQAAGIADPDLDRTPRPPSPPDRITTISRTHVAIPDNVEASYCLYSPPPNVEPKGLLLYNHGFQFGEIGGLDAMLQFVADSGYYVVYPYIRFYVDFNPQNLKFTEEYKQFPALALFALRHALTSLQPQNINHVAVAGHSLGGIAAVRVAETWAQEGSQPPIRAIVLHDPAGLQSLAAYNPALQNPLLETFALDKGAGIGLWGIKEPDLKDIPCETYLLIIQAATSAVGLDAANSAAVELWRNLPQISRFTGTTFSEFRRNFLRVPHDTSHPFPRGVRVSDHLGVMAGPWYPGTTPTPLTSLDYFGYWLPLREALFLASGHQPSSVDYNPYCNTSSTRGTCAKARFMGTWRDQKEATSLLNADDLGLFNGLFNISPIPDTCK